MELKKPITYKEQVDRIRGYGFVVSDEAVAESLLRQANYYRLSAYFLPFQKGECKRVDSIPFERIISIYEFDSKLRAIIYQMVETIEHYLRTQLAYHIGHQYGASGYLEPSMFSQKHRHERFMSHVEKCKDDNKNTLIVKHHMKKYEGKFPIWVIIEFFSMGMISILYADLHRKDQKSISKRCFSTGDRQLESWLRALTELRNKCAHFTRFYYWIFTSIPKSSTDISWRMDGTLFSQMVMLKALFPESSNWNKKIEPLKLLVDEYHDSIDLKHIGFPINWYELLIREH